MYPILMRNKDCTKEIEKPYKSLARVRLYELNASNIVFAVTKIHLACGWTPQSWTPEGVLQRTP